MMDDGKYELSATLQMARQKVDPGTRTEAVRALIAYFCDAVESEAVPDRAVLEYLADGFREFLEGKGSPSRLPSALGLTTKGRPVGDHTIRDAQVAAAVHQSRKQGFTYEDAILCASEKHGVSEKTVKRAYQDFRDLLNMDDDLAKQISELE